MAEGFFNLSRMAWLAGIAVLVMVANIAVSILYMVVYSYLIDPGHGVRQLFAISVVGDHGSDSLCFERLPVSLFAHHRLEGSLHFRKATDQLAPRSSSRPCDQYHRAPP